MKQHIGETTHRRNNTSANRRVCSTIQSGRRRDEYDTGYLLPASGLPTFWGTRSSMKQRE